MELFKSSKLQEHYRNPRNAGCMDNPDGKGRAANPVSGDVIEIYLRIEAGWITEVKFKSFGSPAAIAVSSLLTETVKSRRTDDALVLSSQVLGELVGELAPGDLHCLVLAREAFMSAIDDYHRRGMRILKSATG
ncbi:MAG: iron-sulfur cluster assembly scaffold protein [Syntrophaceae bacterium]